ncbi:MAG: Crp/Fnr family transcriptional regulator [Acidobacteriota bacterium]
MNGASLRSEELQGVDRVWHLRQAPLLKGLSVHDLTAIASLCSDWVYPKGEVIFHQEDPSDSLFILNRGCVRVSVVNSSGREKIIGLFKTGDIFGENLLGAKHTRQVQATAHEECWVSIMTGENFLHLVGQKPALALNLIEILTQKLSEAREDIGALSFLDTEHRVVKTLLQLGKSHGKTTVTRKSMVKLKIPLSHELLARMIGGNRPHISTIMSKFKKRGWVNYQGRKLLINIQALANGADLHLVQQK